LSFDEEPNRCRERKVPIPGAKKEDKDVLIFCEKGGRNAGNCRKGGYSGHRAFQRGGGKKRKKGGLRLGPVKKEGLLSKVFGIGLSTRSRAQESP